MNNDQEKKFRHILATVSQANTILVSIMDTVEDDDDWWVFAAEDILMDFAAATERLHDILDGR